MLKIKNISILLLFVFFQKYFIAQEFEVKSSLLNSKTVDSIFTDNTKKALNIDFEIFRIYSYQDRIGKGYIIFTENNYSNGNGEDYIDSIKAFNFRIKNNELVLNWSLVDFYLPKGNEVSEEFSISFWTKYFELSDFDFDGIIDPIIVYGTLGLNDESDGRIKILVFHNDLKSAIRHQNGTLDFERNFTVDKKYYELPNEIQNQVNKLMESMIENDHAIFPYGWQKAMKNKELKFDQK